MEQFDRVIFYEIIKKDLSLANPLMRSSKKLNRWIHENIELMQMIGLFYQSKLQKQINAHLHRCFNTCKDTDIDFLYIDSSDYEDKQKVVISWKYIDAAAGVRPGIFFTTQILESQVCTRLENVSCFESAELIKNKLSIMYRDAEKYANRKGDFNSYIDILNNFNNIMVKFQKKQQNKSSLTSSIYVKFATGFIFLLVVYYFLMTYTSLEPRDFIILSVVPAIYLALEKISVSIK